jgi:hypothetical protein
MADWLSNKGDHKKMEYKPDVDTKLSFFFFNLNTIFDKGKVHIQNKLHDFWEK